MGVFFCLLLTFYGLKCPLCLPTVPFLAESGSCLGCSLSPNSGLFSSFFLTPCVTDIWASYSRYLSFANWISPSGFGGVLPPVHTSFRLVVFVFFGSLSGSLAGVLFLFPFY